METLTFLAETSRLLDLVVHSLYTQREIFLRELVSNASDALDRLHFESLSRPELIDAAPLEIVLDADPAARTLTVRDNGIGMTRDDLVAHIGTIARSGTREFGARLDAAQSSEPVRDLIGRFGVGFYSCFMVADRVTVVTRRAGEPAGTRWESVGDVHYTLADAGDVPRGTSVILHLKPVDAEAGIEDYLDRWVVSRIVKRYVDFVTYPIVWNGPPPPIEETSGDARPAARVVLNSMKPIWTRPESQVTAEEYQEFYKHLAHDWTPPLLRCAFKAEGRWQYTALLFVPAHAPHDMYYHAASYGLQLYSQRTLVVASAQELLPRYLRFVKGVVDAADLPLNVSRQSLQHAHHEINIRRWITRKVIDSLNKLRETDSAKYAAFWREFGRALKEGISEDRDNMDRLVPLLLFESSFDDTAPTTLADYVSRMKPDQRDIYYLAGESRAVVQQSPQLEECRARGYEILYFTEPVDELVAQSLHEFEGKTLRSLGKGQVAFGDEAERERAQREVDEQTTRFRDLIDFMARHLESHVKGVRISSRLTISPACLTGEEFDFSPHIERLLRASQPQRRTLELNPAHPIVNGLRERFDRNREDALVPLIADLLLGVAVLAEGAPLPDQVAFTAHVMNLMSRSLDATTVSAPQAASAS
jgi:molecular chaperone HtpG